ncbi:hypothetical protein ACFLXY_06645 [Chloroflexota bacterium]
MKKRFFYVTIISTLILSLCSLSAIPALANDVPSSTIVFESVSGHTLTESGGFYTGVIPCVVDGGYDIYAKEGASAWFGDDPGSGPVWTAVTIASHDAWPEPEWDPDTPDWWQYSLYLYEEDGIQKWAIRNHAGATEELPWYESAIAPMGVPMSGTLDLDSMYALELDTGAYLPSTGSPDIPGGAASKGGGAGYWDMDWSWGSEAVPLQYPGFDVTIEEDGDDYTVTFTPAATGTSYLTTEIPSITAISVEPGSIDFGTLLPGENSDSHYITVTNIGTEAIVIAADVEPSPTVFDNLHMWYSAGWQDLPFNDIATLGMGDDVVLETYLEVPEGYDPEGVENAQLVFEITPAP